MLAMELRIEDPEIGDLVGRLSDWTGETPDEAVHLALKERLDRLVADDKASYVARVRAITSRVAVLPVLDPREPDDIIGYNEHGLFD
jgi:antitoxin VapB